MSGEDSGETGWTSDFVLPIVLFFTSYVVLAFGYFVDRCCLYDWHQRRKQELEEMEEAAVRRALEESDDAYISLDSISFGKSIKNLEPFYVFVWLAVALTAVDLFLWYHAFSSWEGPGNDTLANAALALVVGMCFHTVCMPLVLLGKICDWRPSRVSDCCASKPRKPVDHEGRRFTLFSMKLDPGTKKFFTYVGFIFVIIENILDKVAGVIDLRIFWIPSPLLRFAEERAFIQTMRIDYRCIRMDIDYGDAYLRFCYEKLLNALSLTLWEKCMAKKYYKWLDNRMRFIGKPPEKGVNHFYYHRADAQCKTKAKAYALYICCPICASYMLTKARIENMVLGGASVKFRDSFGWVSWTLLCFRRACGITQGCREKLNADLDKQLVFDMYMSDEEVAKLEASGMQHLLQNGKERLKNRITKLSPLHKKSDTEGSHTQSSPFSDAKDYDDKNKKNPLHEGETKDDDVPENANDVEQTQQDDSSQRNPLATVKNIAGEATQFVRNKMTSRGEQDEKGGAPSEEALPAASVSSPNETSGSEAISTSGAQDNIGASKEGNTSSGPYQSETQANTPSEDSKPPTEFRNHPFVACGSDDTNDQQGPNKTSTNTAEASSSPSSSTQTASGGRLGQVTGAFRGVTSRAAATGAQWKARMTTRNQGR